MKKRSVITLAFLVLPLLIFTSCDLTNQDEFYVSFLSGTLSNWQGGSNMEIRLILESKVSGADLVVASSPIDEDGSFSIDSAATPPAETLEAIGQGPSDDKEECFTDYQVSDTTAMIVFGYLAIVDASIGSIVGKVYKATAPMYGDSPDAGNSIVEYIYSDKEFSLSGSENCTFQDGYQNTSEVVVYMSTGWNAITTTTVSRDNQHEIKEIRDGDLFDGEWFYELEGEYNPQEYNFNISGNLQFWDGSIDKFMVLGFEDQNGEIHKFSKTEIGANGDFNFSSAMAPPSEYLMPISEGPAAPRECGIDLTVSDRNARGFSPRFMIMNMNDEIVGEVGYGYDATNTGEIVVGNFFVEIIFADRNVRVQGTVNCSNTDNTHYEATLTNVDINLTEGWNFASRVVTYIDENNNITSEIHEGVLSNARWYWRVY